MSIDGAMCVCQKTHFSNNENKPVLAFDGSGAISGLESTTFWEISINVQGASGAITEAVKYTEQNLSDGQKLRARLNIGAVSSTEVDDKIKVIKIGTSQISDGSVTEAKLSPELIAKITTPTAVIDTEMSDTSTNAVQNKVIKAYVDAQKSDLAAQIQLVSGNLDDVKQDVHDEREKTNAAISSLQEETNSLKANLTGLQEEVTIVKESVSTNGNEIGSLKVRVATVEDSIKNIKPDESLVARVTALETTSTTHTEQISGLSDRVDALENKTYEDPRVNDLVTTVADHETKIAALEEAGGGSSVDLTGIKKTLETHTNEITELKQCVA